MGLGDQPDEDRDRVCRQPRCSILPIVITWQNTAMQSNQTIARLEFKTIGATGSCTGFHFLLARQAVARPGNRFKALNFNRVFTDRTDTVVVVVDTPNRILNGSQLIKFAAFEHKGDFAIAR